MANDKLQTIVELLHAAGWADDGRTVEDTVRVPTQRAPVFGGIGGELRTFGGRRRFAKGDHRCTIGPRVVCFYRWADREASQFVRFPTSHIDAIRTHVVGVDPAEVFEQERRPPTPKVNQTKGDRS